MLPIVELPDGRILVAPHEKSLSLITLSDKFPDDDTMFSVIQIPAPTHQEIDNLFKDSNGRIWITSKKDLFEFIPGTLTTVWRRKIDRISYSQLGKNGGVWTNDIFYNEIVDSLFYPLFTEDVARGHGSCHFHDEEKHRFWLGITDLNELHIFDTRSWERGNPLSPDKVRLKLFDDVTPTNIYKDRTGIIWVGTNGYGIRKFISGSELFQNYLTGKSIRKIIPVDSSSLLVKDWEGLLKVDLGSRNHAYSTEYLTGPQKDIIVDAEFTRWSFVANNKLAQIEKHGPEHNSSLIYKLESFKEFDTAELKFKDSKDRLWITKTGGNFMVFDPSRNLQSNLTIDIDPDDPLLKSAIITSLYEDNEGIFWMGTEYGLAKVILDPAKLTINQIVWYKSNPKDNSSLNYNHVTCLTQVVSDHNIIWVATKGGGLNALDKSTGKFIHITTREGLCNNFIYGILTDTKGNIWGSTNNGIFCLLRTENMVSGPYQFRHFTKAAGLQDNEFNTNAYAKLFNGQLAFGGVNGLTIFDPVSVLTDSFHMDVILTNILIGNKVVRPNDDTGILQESIMYSSAIRLNNKQNFFTLEFCVLDFRAPEQNQYRYQLSGIDHDWIENGSRRTVTYSHLPPGSYIFKVQGTNSLGVWSESVTELRITILPPWWQTWWAYTLYFLLFAVALRTYILFRMNRAKLESELILEHQEAKRIKDLDSLKTQLYANITHEFRTPLTVILGMANQINQSPEHISSGLDMIMRNGNNLLKLINEMLDLSKLEGGKMTLHRKNGDFISFMRYHVESFQSLAESEKKQFHLLSELDSFILAFDVEKMRQIITNLLSNALKFTPPHGHVYVTISQVYTSDRDEKKLQVKIKDTGIGIPEDQLEHIFDRFYQLDNSSSRKTEGTGIGLALTKELIKLMDGVIEVKSPPVGASKGTEFSLLFPVTILPEEEVMFMQPYRTERLPDLKTEVQPIDYSSFITDRKGQPIILLVEDNADVVAYTASCLQDYTVVVAKDGAEGLGIAIEVIPDLILSDVMMPYMDGFEMIDKLRRDHRTSHIPIIMLTAKADLSSKMEGIEKGADAYMEKPFNKEELLLRIKKLLEQRALLQHYYSQKIGIATGVATDLVPEESVQVNEKNEHEFIIRVRDIVESNFSNHEFNVEKLCKLVFMSHSQLHRKLEALTNCSPNRFIRMVRLNKAKELLIDPSKSISTVATESGYNDPGYFARVFKQDTGFTPQEWRIQTRG